VNDLIDALRRAGRAGPVTVTWYGHLSPEVLLALRNDDRVTFVPSDSAPAAQVAIADYAIVNDLPLPPDRGVGVLRPLATFTRPRGGTPLVLYERGVSWNGRFFTTPDALRLGIGGGDSRFDAFIARHPFIRAWYFAVTQPS
jgi:hypothetical protein